MRGYVKLFEFSHPLIQESPRVSAWSMQILWPCPAQISEKKLQKIEGFTGMNSSQLLEIANSVFVTQDQTT